MTPPPAPAPAPTRIPPAQRLKRLPAMLAGMFTRNIPAKLAALILAVLVWFTVRQDLTDVLPRDVAIRVQIEEGLMITAPYPTSAQVVFEGPTSQLAALRRVPEAEVRLRVRSDNLAGQLQATLVFSPERENIAHAYGPEVRIREMRPGSITLNVAVRGRRTVVVEEPAIQVDLPQWRETNSNLETPRVQVVGPEAILQEIRSIRPPPLDATEDLATVPEEQETYVLVRQLPLPEELKDRNVALAPGEEIRLNARFARQGVTEELPVPFRIYFPPGDHPVTLVARPGGPVTGEGEQQTIRVRFTGTPSGLAALKTALAQSPPRLLAYVRADEFDAWREGLDEQQGRPIEIHLEMPENLRSRIAEWRVDVPEVLLKTEAKKKEAE